MRVPRMRRRLALFLGIAAVAALVAAGAAYALTASSFKYSSTKTGYVLISHMAFAPDDNDDVYFNDWSNGVGNVGAGCLNAGLNVPIGSKIKSITFYYKSGATDNLYAELRYRQLANGATEAFSVSPNNDAGTLATATAHVPLAQQTVTAGRTWGVGVCPGSDGGFFGAKVKYTYTSAGS